MSASKRNRRRWDRLLAFAATGILVAIARPPVGHAAEVEPEGIWGCLIYGHQRLGDERLLLRFLSDGSTDMARPRADGFRIWMPLTNWSIRRRQLRFVDPRTGREFESDLRQETLGGTWESTSMNGGWWCAAIDWDLEEAFEGLQRSQSPDLMPPLVADVLAAPRYPRQAIREAKEGRAVACYLVDADGSIRDPSFVELSDEIFRATTLRALEGSSYRGWIGAAAVRPGCRAFDYRLDSIH